MELACAKNQLKSENAFIKMQLKKDWSDKAQSVAHRADLAAKGTDHRELYSCARELAPRKWGALNMVKCGDGNLTATAYQRRQWWQRFFASKLGGKTTTMEDMATDDQYLRETCCMACGTEFHSRQRILTHVAYRTPSCLAFYREHVSPISEKECDKLDKQARVKEPMKALLKPAVKKANGNPELRCAT